MAVQLKLRRDTATDLALATPVEAEPGYDQTNKRLIVGDGVRAGGIPHAAFHDVQNSAFSYAAATGTDTLTASLSPAPAAYVAGQSFKIKAAATNTGAVTIDINALGARNVKKMGDSGKEALEAGDIVAGGIYTLDYDGSEFIVSGGIGEAKNGWVLLQTETVSNASSIEFTAIDATYDEYQFVIEYMNPITNGDTIAVQVYSGAAWQGSNYSNSIMVCGDNSINGFSADSDPYINITGQMANNAATVAHGKLALYAVNDTARHKRIVSEVGYASSTGTIRETLANTTGRWASTAVVSGFRFLASTGNITGKIRMYGLAQ